MKRGRLRVPTARLTRVLAHPRWLRHSFKRGVMDWDGAGVCVEAERLCERSWGAAAIYKRWHGSAGVMTRVDGVEVILNGIAWRLILNRAMFE
jgi:hypothetical protein